MTNTDESDATGTGILLIFGTTPSHAHSRKNLTADGDIENAIAGLDKFDVGVLLADEANDFGRIDRGERHVGAEFHACESGHMI